MHTGFRWGDMLERDCMEDLGIGGMENMNMDLQEMEWEAWTELIWLWIGTGGRHL